MSAKKRGKKRGAAKESTTRGAAPRPLRSRSRVTLEGGHELHSTLERREDGFVLSQLLKLTMGDTVRVCTINCGGKTVQCSCPGGKKCKADCSDPDNPKCRCV